jgi:hypothetical protein
VQNQNLLSSYLYLLQSLESWSSWSTMLAIELPCERVLILFVNEWKNGGWLSHLLQSKFIGNISKLEQLHKEILLQCMCQQGIQNVLSYRTDCPYPSPRNLSRLYVLPMLSALITGFCWESICVSAITTRGHTTLPFRKQEVLINTWLASLNAAYKLCMEVNFRVEVVVVPLGSRC